MKTRVDLVRGWLRKAASDLVAMDASLTAGALDAACFHAPQAVEKTLKAFLIHHEKDFPYTRAVLCPAECRGRRPRPNERPDALSSFTPERVIR